MSAATVVIIRSTKRLPFSSFFTKKAGENLVDAIFSLDLSLNPRGETVQKVGRNKRMFTLGV